MQETEETKGTAILQASVYFERVPDSGTDAFPPEVLKTVEFRLSPLPIARLCGLRRMKAPALHSSQPAGPLCGQTQRVQRRAPPIDLGCYRKITLSPKG
jgi:hypothetical protein